MALDKGAGVSHVRDVLESHAPLIDYVKLGWGTSIVDSRTKTKCDLYRDHGVDICLGGTLFELALRQDRISEFVKWSKSLGANMIEVSDGTIKIPHDEKLELISKLAVETLVVSEYGSKDSQTVTVPKLWAEGIALELEAGAWRVVAEGRESGTSGLYRTSSEIRGGLIDEIALSVDPDLIIWEAPLQAHQTFLIKRFGANVNLGNIALNDIVPLETLRLGLRSDSLEHFHGLAAADEAEG